MTTTEGSITAYVRAETGQFKRDMAEAQVAIDDLRKSDPTVTVHADVAEALAKIEAVKAAARDGGTNIPDRSGGGNSNGGGNVGRYGAIAAVVAGLIPMAADLAGFLAADAGAFAGMGASGVLAIAGIKSEMQSGSAEGHMYTSLIQTITGDLGELEATAAKGVLGGFEASVQAVNNAMPALNQEIGLFSAGLGRASAMSVDGLVTGFKVLNPLFLQGQGYLLGLIADFDQWTHSSSGLTQWASDAQRVFPLVADTVNTLIQTVLQLVGDLAPLGTAMLTVLDGAAHVAEFLTSVLGPAFGPVTLGVVATVIAFQNFSTIAPILDALTGGVFALAGAQDVAAASADTLAASETAVQVAAGPAGWVMLAASAAVGVLTGALVLGGQAAAGAATAQANYMSQVQQDAGVIGAATQKQLAQNLAMSGAADQAKEFGISMTQVTAAITQGGAVKAKLISQLEQIAAKNTQAIGTGRSYHVVANQQADDAKKLIATIESQSGAVDAATSAYRKQNATLVTLAIQAQQQITQQGALQLNYGLTAAQVAAAADEQNNLATQTAFVSSQLAVENTAAQNLQNQLQLMDNGTLSLRESQTAAAAATLTLSSTLKKNHDALSLNTAAGVADRQAIEQKVQADQAAAAAVAKSTGSLDAGTASLVRSRDALEKQLQKLGLLTPAVKAYIEQIDKIPSSRTTVIGLDVGSAYRTLNQLQSAIQSGAPGGHLTTSGNGYAHADGGPIYRAGGGFALLAPKGTDTIPAMLSPGEFVVKQKSAAAAPGFLTAFNANPAAAINALQQQAGTLGGGSSAAAPTSLPHFINFIQQATQAIKDSTAAYNLNNTATTILSLQLQKQITQQGKLASTYGLTAAQVVNLAREQQGLATTSMWVNSQLNLLNVASGNYQNQLTLMNDGSLNVAQAQSAAASATNTLTDALKTNHALVVGNSAGSIADQQAIQQKIAADQAEAQAILNKTGSQHQANAALASSRTLLERQLATMHLLTPAIKAYINALDKVPTVKTAGTHAVPHGHGMPKTLVVVDADGALIGRMRVEAARTTQAQTAARTAALKAGKRSH